MHVVAPVASPHRFKKRWQPVSGAVAIFCGGGDVDCTPPVASNTDDSPNESVRMACRWGRIIAATRGRACVLLWAPVGIANWYYGQYYVGRVSGVVVDGLVGDDVGRFEADVVGAGVEISQVEGIVATGDFDADTMSLEEGVACAAPELDEVLVDLDGRIVADAVGDALEMVVEPAADVAVPVDGRCGAVVEAQQFASAARVGPGTDDDSGASGFGRGAVLLHGEVVHGCAGEVGVEPAGDGQRRYLDLGVLLLGLVGDGLPVR